MVRLGAPLGRCRKSALNTIPRAGIESPYTSLPEVATHAFNAQSVFMPRPMMAMHMAYVRFTSGVFREEVGVARLVARNNAMQYNSPTVDKSNESVEQH